MTRVAVVTVSDSASRGTREDLSGPLVAARAEARGWKVTAREVTPDDVELLSGLLAGLADGGGCEVIFSTGGTGIAERDVTPEATRAVITKELPGLGELMRVEGLKHTRRAVLSRAVAGIRGRTLIVNLPGSPKGAGESFDAVADLVEHIVELLAGRTEHREEAKLG